jgi:tripartite-type tricarboxylate transporter receptor subunit TctC
MHRKLFAFALSIFALMSPVAAQESVAGFYTGKQIRIVVGSASGGGYDIISRVLARYMGNHIPGSPSFIVQNMPGAGSVSMTNLLVNSGPFDGTAIGGAINGMPTAPLLTPEIAKFDPAKLIWLGSTNREIQAVIAWHTAPVQSLDDLTKKDLVVGAASAGTATLDFPLVTNAILNVHFKIIRGYEGTPQINHAMESGEVQGNGGIGWASIKTQSSAWLASGKIKVIGQYGLERIPDLKDIPTFMELSKTEDQRQALRLVFARQEYGRPFFLPPGVPAARVEALRRAFDATMRDPEFLAEAARLQLDIEPMTGPDVAALIAKVSATPREVVERVQAALIQGAK